MTTIEAVAIEIGKVAILAPQRLVWNRQDVVNLDYLDDSVVTSKHCQTQFIFELCLFQTPGRLFLIYSLKKPKFT